MTPEDVLYRQRLRAFALAEELGSVRAACRMLGPCQQRSDSDPGQRSDRDPLWRNDPC